MGRARTGEKVFGPYPHRKCFRVFIVAQDGARRNFSFKTKVEAEAFVEVAKKEIESTVLMEALFKLYEEYLTAKGNKAYTIKTTLYRLKLWMPESMAVEQVTPSYLSRYYDKRTKAVKADSHRNELKEVKTFWKWAVHRGYAKRNPVEKVEPIGKRSVGKPQLRRAEAAALYQWLMYKCTRGDHSAVATLLTLALGLRASEILRLTRRDIDTLDGNTCLWVSEAKTRAGVRCIDVPSALAVVLQKHLASITGDIVFPTSDSKDGYHTRTWLLKNTKRLCEEAGVPKVPPHGLRGTHATIALSSGAAADVVSKALGHSNVKITLSAYATPKAAYDNHQQRTLPILTGEVPCQELSNPTATMSPHSTMEKSNSDSTPKSTLTLLTTE